LFKREDRLIFPFTAAYLPSGNLRVEEAYLHTKRGLARTGITSFSSRSQEVEKYFLLSSFKPWFQGR
jgi:hypothetical protein